MQLPVLKNRRSKFPDPASGKDKEKIEQIKLDILNDKAIAEAVWSNNLFPCLSNAPAPIRHGEFNIRDDKGEIIPFQTEADEKKYKEILLSLDRLQMKYADELKAFNQINKDEYDKIDGEIFTDVCKKSEKANESERQKLDANRLEPYDSVIETLNSKQKKAADDKQVYLDRVQTEKEHIKTVWEPNHGRKK